MSKRKNDKKKWAYQAEWDESESKNSSDDSSDAEKTANIYFIAIESEVFEIVSNFSFDELNGTFNDLYERY